MADKKVCILDYGSGNVKSVYNLMSSLESTVVISNNVDDIKSSTHIVLPGVGAFGSSMDKIKTKIQLNILETEVLQNGKPFLGICVGMQVLFKKGYEFDEFEGLGWIPGAVRKLDTRGLPLPHIGWNNVFVKNRTELLKNVEDDLDFYFVHSYAFLDINSEYTIGVTEYGQEFASVIQKENIYGVQFHPEKSQKAGKLLLKNFLEIQ